VYLELIAVLHRTALRMVQEALHSSRYEVLCRSSNYVTVCVTGKQLAVI